MTHWKIALYITGAMASAFAAGITDHMDTVGWVKLIALTIAAGASAGTAYFDKTAGREAVASEEVARVVMNEVKKEVKK